MALLIKWLAEIGLPLFACISLSTFLCILIHRTDSINGAATSPEVDTLWQASDMPFHRYEEPISASAKGAVLQHRGDCSRSVASELTSVKCLPVIDQQSNAHLQGVSTQLVHPGYLINVGEELQEGSPNGYFRKLAELGRGRLDRGADVDPQFKESLTKLSDSLEAPKSKIITSRGLGFPLQNRDGGEKRKKLDSGSQLGLETGKSSVQASATGNHAGHNFLELGEDLQVPGAVIKYASISKDRAGESIPIHEKDVDTPLQAATKAYELDAGVKWNTDVMPSRREKRRDSDELMAPSKTGVMKHEQEPTSLHHLFFCTTSSVRRWQKQAPFLRTWWDPQKVRGGVWMEALPSDGDDIDGPQLHVSGNMSGSSYYNNALQPIVQEARVLKEAFGQNLHNVRWFVVGTDETFFSPGGVAALLSKYDYRQFLYIGSQSEDHWQNTAFSHEMAFGGAGYAVSWPLAEALNRTLDNCLGRLLGFQTGGSDMLLAACIAELGVRVTNERGFHQCDVHGSLSGLLEAHVPEVFASLYHTDRHAPMLPTSPDRIHALQHISKAIQPDPVGFLQQAVCYDHRGGQDWTASIAWGYSVKFYPKLVRFSELERVEHTFGATSGARGSTIYDMDTRKLKEMAPLSEKCNLPFVMYVSEVKAGPNATVESTYNRPNVLRAVNRTYCHIEPARLTSIRVIRPQPLHVTHNGLSKGPILARQCCKHFVFKSNEHETLGTIWLGNCEEGELVGRSFQ